MPVPISSGWLKFSPALNLNKIEHFSKVSIHVSRVGTSSYLPFNEFSFHAYAVMLSTEMTLNGETGLIKMYPKFNSSHILQGPKER